MPEDGANLLQALSGLEKLTERLAVSDGRGPQDPQQVHLAVGHLVMCRCMRLQLSAVHCWCSGLMRALRVSATAHLAAEHVV